jgi:hypothetical protein
VDQLDHYVRASGLDVLLPISGKHESRSGSLERMHEWKEANTKGSLVLTAELSEEQQGSCGTERVLFGR